MSERIEAVQAWVEQVLESNDVELKPASEDASFRRYFRATHNGNSHIVMDAPPQHEDCGPFISVTEKLHASHVNAPQILAKDMEQGFLLLSDFGNTLYLDKLNQQTVKKLYVDAIRTLIQMQVNGDVQGLNNYDETLLLNEMCLFDQWLLDVHLDINLSDEDKQDLNVIYKVLVNNALQQPQVFVHRDYHSRNLMWVEQDNPGVIDYQDAVNGPLSYDLVSLLKDCYIKWSRDEIQHWVDYYLQELAKSGYSQQIERKAFQRWFDLMGVQRHLKASGIFARLFHRDGKSGFLKDIPRTLSYIIDLKGSYPELQFLIHLLDKTVIPALEKH